MSSISEIALRLLVVPLLTVSTAMPVMAGNWPAWRGSDGTGRSSERNLPVSWSPTENVTWKTPLPGEGNSTPITWENRVFLTCPVEGGKVRRLILSLIHI